MSRIALEGVSKAFGGVTVIQNLDLTIEEGEFVALIGPSGCGKSTLLRMIAGLEAPTSGSIVMDRGVVNDLSPKERNVAMVFQNYALYPHMTVRQNMGLNLKVAGVPKDEVEARVTESARLLGVDKLLDRKPNQLSGGQRQRVAMGRAIVRKPELFLFDEPLSNLDANLRVQMRGEIKALQHKVRTTSIYVTHDQIEAMTLADRVVVLREGHIEQQGSPIELYMNPKNRFVAGFIGSPSMNFLDATLQSTDVALAAKVSDMASVAVRDAGASAGEAVTIGIRPEHIKLSETPTAFQAVLDYVEPTGAQTLMVLDMGGQKVSALLEGIVQRNRGDLVSLRVDTKDVLVFDPAGNRIDRK